MEKSLILTIEEAKEDLVKAINEIKSKHSLPMYLLEIILGNIYNQVSALKQQELELAKQEYEKSKEKDTKK
jgi:hypothetical protein